ncbi:LysR substrate-binding domain-containing protein [Chelatococcus asaccharovorans]|uniref:LysR family transcriptional regulator n=1 Tax=Chelatococcus asaccharovorans TaxID=28210 RepID=A0A2V3TZJ8_9HYPH|nr:LysR substrate-binding domain-containing protein [Chelatococcus asaccharovorans]MBS7707755.1 LysR family transcriptional regulator [Chelatococcus asaccharovorans]PXW55332.1 LysR family transcriptional regulator [Chelatococcus asaccharovorans]
MLPPLPTLRIFEAAARRQSFLLAAGELHLTPGAVSKQIRQLELHLGQPLFERLHRQVRLTPAGHAYGLAIGRIFDDLRTATAQASAAPAPDTLVLWCAPWFLKAWLLPRLDGFRSLYPGVQLDIRTGDSSDTIDPQAVIAIRLGLGTWPRMRHELLVAQEIAAVCTPGYLRRKGLIPPLRFGDIVVLDSANTPHHLDLWKQAAGLERETPRERILFQSNETAFAAALSDHGLALVNPHFVAKQLAEGRLICPWRAVTKTDRNYWLTWAKGFDLPPVARTFRKWLLREFRGQKMEVSLP